jgi:predicted Zn-dependent peptidase
MAPKKPNKTILDNGVRILTKHIPHVRSVSMGVWVNAGARDELPEQNGLSHFIEHMIFKGTEKRTAYQIAKEFDAIGGYTNAFTSMEITCYHAKVIDTHLAKMVDILSDIFLHSKFDPGEVEKERTVILQEISMTEDSPEDLVHTLLSGNFWGENPLGRSILGTRQNVCRFSTEMIRSYFQRFYQPDRIIVSAAGNIDHGQFIDLIRPSFETIARGGQLPLRETPTKSSRTSVFHKQLEQVHIGIGCQGMKTTDPRRYAFSVLNTMFGGNMSSRLFQEIRERRGLAYSVYSFISSYADTGMLGIYSGVSPDKTTESIELILKELDRLYKMPVDDAELHDAKECLKGGILLSAENTDNQMVRLAQNEINFGRYIPLWDIITEIDAVTADDIIDLATAMLADKVPAITLLGPVAEQETGEALLQTLN